MRRLLIVALLTVLVTSFGAAEARPAGSFELSSVGRVTFPARAFVVDLPSASQSGRLSAIVHENGHLIEHATLAPMTNAGLSAGVVLAIDASDSMKGAPISDATDAARSFVERGDASQRVGLVTFNGRIATVARPSASRDSLLGALARPPVLGYGTRLYDGVGHALALLESSQTAAGSVIVLTDGVDVGSNTTLHQVVERAKLDHVRIFAVGLKSATFDPSSLSALGRATGGSFAEASSSAELASIYRALSGKLTGEYLLRYRSSARSGDQVNVSVDVQGVGRASADYTAPESTPSAPFHRSLAARFILSTASTVALALFAAALVAFAILSLSRRRRGTVVDRIGAFVDITEHPQAALRRRSIPGPPRRRPADGFLSRLAVDFEIGGVALAPILFVLATAVSFVLALAILALISPPLALLSVLVPVTARVWVASRVKRVRDSFADQLPETLQLLASALRTGHSFVGALSVVIDQAPEPTKTEFGQVLTDDQIGVPIDESLRRISVRMENRDMEQVSLLGELQRTAGGNSAEVLDIVVATVRERADVRRLARTLTAQGRMARWILTLLPLVVGLFLAVTEGSLMRPLFTTGIGQVFLVGSTLSVVTGSLWIKRIIEIKV